MSRPPQIVAIGLLTQRDLDILGQGFDRDQDLYYGMIYVAYSY